MDAFKYVTISDMLKLAVQDITVLVSIKILFILLYAVMSVAFYLRI